MASYQLIKQASVEVEGALKLQRQDCVVPIDGNYDGPSGPTLQGRNPSSPARNAAANDLLENTPSSSGRLVSLDVFRGLTVVLMIIVDNAGGVLPAINHSPWNGLTLADFVMPFFLFMVGVSLSLVYKNMSCQAAASSKALLRTLKLLILGIFLQGGFFHGINDVTYGVDLEQIRWMGILQRIAVAYSFAALCEIWLRNNVKVVSAQSLLKKYQGHWIMMAIVTAVYLVLLYGLYVPDWEYGIPDQTETSVVKCGVRADTGPACNAAGMIDRAILGIRHLYRKPVYARTEQCSVNSPDYGPLPPNAPSWCKAPFDPEGILGTVMSIVTSFIGLQYGHVLVHFKNHNDRLLLWLGSSSIFVIVGVLCDISGMHMNKALYSLSYTCITAGVAGLLLAAIYVVVDVHGYRQSMVMTVLKWIGMNSLMIYILVACNIIPLVLQGFYWQHPRSNVFSLIGIGKQVD